MCIHQTLFLSSLKGVACETVDCGLFAITYAVSLVNGNDPAKTKSAQWSMKAFFTDRKSTQGGGEEGI